MIYIVATVFRVNDFPCANNVRSIGEKPFQENKVQLVALFPDTFCKTVISYLKTALTS